MPRIRTLKPDFWSDKRMVKLSAYTRLFYMGMWTFSICHNGHLDDDAEELKLKILPLDEVDADQLLSELIDAGRVKRCVANDSGTYLWVPTLAEHQNIDPRWTPRCRYCAQEVPPVLTEPQRTPYEDARASPSHIGETPSLAPGRDRKGRDSKNTSPPAAPVGESDEPSPAKRKARVVDDPEFARFWQAFPRPLDKGHARKAWATAIRNGADPATVVAAAEAFAGHCARNRTEAKFIPYPATWLNGERWADQRPNTPAASDSHVPWWDA